ncbi:MAG: DotA/TraY family protein [Pseudomonadota bacterium]|nr:DotA/TraY family protein [Pseudomonadota bacterium]
MAMRLIWLLALLPGFALADTSSGSFPMLFDIAQNDLSISYLKILFGQVGSVLLGPPNTLVQEIFTIFNLGIMTLAGVLMCYTVVLSVVNTSQEGNPMGHKMSPWVVVRIVTGSAFMMPMSTGYAMIQVITMWMVIQGIGFADMIWSKAVDVISSSPTGVYPTSAGDNNPYLDIYNSKLLDAFPPTTDNPSGENLKTTIANFFASSVCLRASFQKDIAAKPDSTMQSDYYISIGSNSDGQSVDTNSCDYINNLCFITPNDSVPGDVCGRYIAPIPADTEAQFAAVNAAYAAALAVNSYVESIFDDALTKIQQDPVSDEPIESEVARGLACLDGTFNSSPQDQQQYWESCAQTAVLDGIAASYLGALGSYAYKTSTDDSSDTDDADWAQEAKSYGWLSAGAYYTSISASDTGTIDTGSTTAEINPLLYSKVSETFAFQAGDDFASTIFNIFDIFKYEDGKFVKSNNYPNSFSFLNSYFMSYAKGEMYALANASDISSDNGASGDCEFDSALTTTLDNSIKLLAKYWLKWSGGQGSDGADDCSDWTISSNLCSSNSDNPFQKMKLWSRAQLSISEAENSKVFFIGAPQRSLYVLLNRSLSELLGVKYFSDFAHNASDSFGAGYGDQSGNPQGGHSDWSDVNTFADACNADLISSSGHGLYGEVLATMRGLGYQPLAQMRFMGLNLMRYGVDYFSTTIAELINMYSRVGLAYWGLSAAFATVLSAGTGAVIYFYALAEVPSTVPAAVAAVAQMASNVFNSGMNILYQVDQINISLWQPLAAAMAVTYTILGFIMGVYMANVPAIIFVFAAISFFMYVIEAMIASVLVALGLTHPEGHDLLGKAEQSIMLFLAAFIRPAAMIMGLIFSMLLMIPAFRLLNFTFIGFIGEYFSFFSDGDKGSIVPLIGAIGVAFLYAYLAMGIINNCFSLIYQIPDRLLRWLGAPTEPSMIQQMVNEVKGSVSEAAKSAGGGAEAASGSAKVSAQASISPITASNTPGTKKPEDKKAPIVKNKKDEEE